MRYTALTASKAPTASTAVTPEIGLRCEILVNKKIGDCSNGGLSATVDEVVLLDDRLAEITEHMKQHGGYPVKMWPARDDAPAVRLAQTVPGYVVARPVEKPAGVIGPMEGGSYIVSHDERWVMLTGSTRPIPLYDRFESPEQYRALSID